MPGSLVDLLRRRRMGSQMTKYKMKVQRRRKIEGIREFLSQLCLDCDGHANDDVPAVASVPFVTILEGTREFLTRLIALLDNLNVINQRSLDNGMVSVTERALGEIQETGEMLILVIRYVLLGRSYGDIEGQELDPVRDMFERQISAIKDLFLVIIRHVEDAIHITRPSGQYLFKDELEPTLTDVLHFLLLVKEQLSDYHQYQNSTMRKFNEIMQELQKRATIKIFAVAFMFFSISVYELFSTTSIAWAVTLSITCGFTEWFVTNYMIKTSSIKLMYDKFKLKESQIINTRYNGRLFCIDG